MPLAHDLGGAAWDLNLLRDGGLSAESFTAAFIEIKVQEIAGELLTFSDMFMFDSGDTVNKASAVSFLLGPENAPFAIPITQTECDLARFSPFLIWNQCTICYSCRYTYS